MECHGFVHTNSDVEIDGVLPANSSMDETGNWILEKDCEQVGYWSSLFCPSLAHGAERATFGGEISKKRRTTQMGNGRYELQGEDKAAAIDRFGIYIINEIPLTRTMHFIWQEGRLLPTGYTVTRAALQMLRELQRFKEVEKLVEPSFREGLNAEKKTPRMLFTDELKDLVEKGEKWMKDTASSSMVVAALIFTVAFAATFTAPGGNDDFYALCHFGFGGFIFLSHFSAHVLGNAHVPEGDFLYATHCPKESPLDLWHFLSSIAAIMVTFCTALANFTEGEVGLDCHSGWADRLCACHVLCSAAVSLACGIIPLDLILH